MGPGAAAAYRGEDVGVHLTVNAEHDLYRWGPITHAPSLLDGDGGFPRTVADVWDHADLDEVRRECRAQIERAILWGFDVSHLDAHMGTMQIKSEFFDVYLDLAVEFRLPLRLSGPETESLIGFPFRRPGRRGGRRVPRRLRRTCPGWAAAEVLLDAIPQIGPGVTEAYLHPAVASPELEAMATDWEERVDDHRLLVHDRDLAEALAEAGVTLIGYRQLRDLMRGQLIARPDRRAQNSVIAAISVWSCLYSGALVMGSRAMTLAMFPVTLTLPCMKAALASSSPFWIFTASS